MTIFEAGEDVDVAATDLVDIVCESSEFSVNDFRWKGNRIRFGQSRLEVSPDLHNSPPQHVPRIHETTNQLERFPPIHSNHHNNKPYQFPEINLKILSILKSCSDSDRVWKTLTGRFDWHLAQNNQTLVPHLRSFPQAKIIVGTSQFLEKRVQYRISTKFT